MKSWTWALLWNLISLISFPLQLNVSVQHESRSIKCSVNIRCSSRCTHHKHFLFQLLNACETDEDGGDDGDEEDLSVCLLQLTVHCEAGWTDMKLQLWPRASSARTARRSSECFVVSLAVLALVSRWRFVYHFSSFQGAEFSCINCYLCYELCN